MSARQQPTLSAIGSTVSYCYSSFMHTRLYSIQVDSFQYIASAIAHRLKNDWPNSTQMKVENWKGEKTFRTTKKTFKQCNNIELYHPQKNIRFRFVFFFKIPRLCVRCVCAECWKVFEILNVKFSSVWMYVTSVFTISVQLSWNERRSKMK